MQVGSVKIGNFRRKTRNNSKTVQDRRIVLLKSNTKSYALYQMPVSCVQTAGVRLYTRPARQMVQEALLWQRPRDALVSRNTATTKHPILKIESRAYRVALFV